MKQPDAPDHDAWCVWHPTELARCLTGVSVPWCVAGGWALDLWHGHQTREHEDLEFTVLRSDVPVFRRALADMEFHTAGDGIVKHLPAQSATTAETSQVWCLDVVQHCWRVDMMIGEGSPDLWVYKRNPTISVPRADIVATTPAGISYLKPAAILLFKAKHGRPKDEGDFANALPTSMGGKAVTSSISNFRASMPDLLLEAMFTMPLQEVRVRTFGQSLWADCSAAAVDDALYAIGIVCLAGDQDFEIVRQADKAAIEHPMGCSR